MALPTWKERDSVIAHVGDEWLDLDVLIEKVGGDWMLVRAVCLIEDRFGNLELKRSSTQDGSDYVRRLRETFLYTPKS